MLARRWLYLIFLSVCILLSVPGFTQDSSFVTRIGLIPTNLGNPLIVSIDSNIAYIGTNNSFVIFDVTDIANPRFLGSCPLPHNEVIQIVANDSIAFVLDRFGLRSVDVTNRALPRIIGNYEQANVWCSGFTVRGNFAYLACLANGLQIIDVTNPVSMRMAGSRILAGDARAVAVEGNYAFVACETVGLQVVNIATVTNPVVSASLDTPGLARKILINNQHAYIADEVYGVQAINVRNPLAPSNIGFYVCTNIGFVDIVSFGDYVYLATVNAIHVINISEPTLPIDLSRYNIATVGLCVQNGRLYVADHNQVLVMNTTNPSALSQEASISYSDVPGRLTTQGSFVYVGFTNVHDGINSLRVFDLTNPSVPLETASIPMPGYVFDVEVVGNRLYVATSGVMLILSLVNPDEPVELGRLYTTHAISDLAVREPYLYLAEIGHGLRIVNASNPSAIAQIGFFAAVDSFTVAALGDYALMSTNPFRVLDLSDPTTPQQVYTSNSMYGAVTLAGQRGYLARRGAGIQIVDFTNPLTPQILGTYDTPDDCYMVAVTGDYIYAADGMSGLRILNAATPASVYEVGYYDIESEGAQFVAVSGAQAVVSELSRIAIYDCSQALGVVERIGAEIPSDFQIEKIYPNPFNANATLTYTLPNTANIKLELFNITGRSVGTVFDWSQDAGTYSVKIKGESLTSGTYFAHLETNHQSRIAKFTVLK